LIKNDEKVITKSGVKLGQKLTIKRGDSGSAGLLERKCVIIGAPNLVSENDQKWCQQQKLTKNHQNQKMIKNAEIKKM